MRNKLITRIIFGAIIFWFLLDPIGYKRAWHVWWLWLLQFVAGLLLLGMIARLMYNYHKGQVKPTLEGLRDGIAIDDDIPFDKMDSALSRMITGKPGVREETSALAGTSAAVQQVTVPEHEDDDAAMPQQQSNPMEDVTPPATSQ